MRNNRIGIVGGRGVIGGAIVRGLLERGLCTPAGVMICGRQPANQVVDAPAPYTDSSEALADACPFIILSVRPQDFRALSIDLTGKTVLSVMAGVTVDEIRARTQARAVIRALPNAAAQVCKSYTPYYIAGELSALDRQIVRQICEAIGTSGEVPDEAAIDYFTGLTGSGLGFVALLADAMIRHAVQRGYPETLATAAVRMVFHGSGELIAAAPHTPREMADQLKGYKGTTEAALVTMENAGFVEVVAQGLEAADAKARAMSVPQPA